MDSTEVLTQFIARRGDLWPPGAQPPLELRPATEGSSGDVWLMLSRGSQPCGILRRCEIRRSASQLIAAHALALRAPEARGHRIMPRLLSHDFSWWRTRRVGGPVLIEEWIEGRSLASEPSEVRRDHAAAVGEALAVLHSVTPRRGEEPVNPRGRLEEMMAHRLRDVAGLFAEEENELLKQATGGLLAEAGGAGDPVLTHTHLAADDILLRPGGGAVLIDIGSLQFGPREADLVDALHALGLADADQGPLMGPYLAPLDERAREGVRGRMPLFHLLRDLGKLRARLRTGAAAETLAPLRARVIQHAGQFRLRSPSGAR